METILLISAICWVLAFVAAYFVMSFLFPDLAFQTAVGISSLSSLLIFFFLIIHGRWIGKRYARFEKGIASPVFCKINGNFNLGNRVKNGNIYFCETGILFASLEEKPFIVEELPLQNIEKYEFDDTHMNIYSTDGRKFLITTAAAAHVLQILKDRGWIA